ncbi:DUF2188 domain-containing protein [Paucilactobacillus nenjiangensis]|jgi:hypothetical protein|uniref:DUF2188 domain-containing protein n=1 Tax=Paucilactobacillus nenjiangensis TaxID=1296540 RepID=A0A5P1X0Z1_9LACO|nr:DUF2188 domain-containing protein [Paucilactobacillus nenjiangensis]QER67560.1 DUF2188 domain-containing protein [Paucilactobacillus nenjiangensis]
MAKKNQWVVPHGDKWAVQGEGNSKATKLFDNKTDALNFGRETAKNQHSELIAQKKNGKINYKNSYGNDPNPPKDKK